MKMTGKVKWFNDAKGYGFIEAEGYPDIFAYYTQIQNRKFKTLVEEELVEFDLDELPSGGLQALNINRKPEAHE